METREGAWWFNFASAVILGFVVIALACAVSGCAAFYENSGSRTRVGTLTAPIEVSDGTDSFTAKLLYGMDGADVYTRKDSRVTVEYDNCWTNTYVGMVTTRGKQRLKVEVEPLYVGETCETNNLEGTPAGEFPAEKDATSE